MDLCRGDGGVVGKGSWCKSDGDFDSATTFWEVQPRGPSYLPTRSLLPGEGATQQMRPQERKQQLGSRDQSLEPESQLEPKPRLVRRAV